MHRTRAFAARAAWAGTLILGVSQVQAQTAAAGAEATAGGLEEVTVTAQRRVERLQDVPISISAVSQEKIDQQGIRSIDDLTRLTPGLNFQRNGMSSSGNYNDEGSDINIRGVDSTAGTSTTGIYIDDTPIQTRHVGFGSINAFPALFDLDRVEVLRGPQGTLFGAGAEGGVVRFIAPEPNLNTASGYFRGEAAATQYGSPSYEAGAAVGAPLIDGKLAVRASVSFRRDGGWVDRTDYTLSPPGGAGSPTGAPNPTPIPSGVSGDPNANWTQTTTLRLALKWQVTDNLEVSPSLYYQRLLIHDTAAYWTAISNPDQGVYLNGNALRNPSNDPFMLTALRIKWDLGFAQLFSNTSFYNRNQRATSDYTQYLRATWNLFGELANTFKEPGDQGYATFQDQQRNIYQEIRLASNDPNARLVWSGGVFFSYLSEEVPESIYDPTLNQEIIRFTGGALALCDPTVPAFACPGGRIYSGPLDKVIDRQYALFGEGSFKITDTLKATVGLRLSKVDYYGTVGETGPFLGETIYRSNAGSDKPVTPKAVLTWQPTRDNMVYLSGSKGFRPGGINIGVGQICGGSLTALGIAAVPNQFSADHLWSYEIGAKNTLLDRKLQINASLFYIDWNDIQQNVYLPSCGEQFTANLGKAKSEGGDIEVIYRPVESLTLDLSAAYTDARLTKTSCAGVLKLVGTQCVGPTASGAPIATDGDALLGAPWTITASAEYHLPLWRERQPYLRVDYLKQTAQNSLLQGQDPRNALFDATLPGLPNLSNINARLGLRFAGADLSAFVNNLTNQHPLMFLARDIAAPTDLLYFGRGVRPRTFGVTATYRY